jgi:hypothetical protein
LTGIDPDQENKTMMPQPKVVFALDETSTTAAATATARFDCLGYDALTIMVRAGTANVVSNKPTVLKLQEADTTDATNLVNISGFVGGTDFTIPNANTAATATLQNDYQFNVDCRARKRYIVVSISPATTQLIKAVGFLSRGENSPVNASKANAMTLVEG